MKFRIAKFTRTYFSSQGEDTEIDRALGGKTVWRVLKSVIAVILICSGLLEEGFAQSADESTNDVVLVLDASGSMKATDPGRLRDEGANLFTSFLQSTDSLGVVSFSDTAQVLHPLTEYSEDYSKNFKRELDKVGSEGLYTDITSGIEQASALLQTSGRPGSNKIIVLLSDGKMDPIASRGTAESQTTRLLDQIIPDLKAKGIKIYTLCFSDEADKDLLRKIALGTEALNWFTPTADQIHKSFADLFLSVKKPQVLPLTKKGFSVDGGIEEATFYLTREEGAEVVLTPPGGENYSLITHPAEIKWFRGEKFDVVTVKEPKPGIWQVAGIDGSDGFATILTDLKLIADWPTVVTSGESIPLKARLFDAKKPVALPEMTEVVKYAFQISPTDKIAEPIIKEFLEDKGENGDKIERDGVFSRSVVVPDPGEYRVRVLVRGPTFEREQNIPFRVRPPLITLELKEGPVPGNSAVPKDEHSKEAAPAAKDGEKEGEVHEDGDAAASKEGDDAHHEEVVIEEKPEVAPDPYLFIKVNPEIKKPEVTLYALDMQKRTKIKLPLSRAMDHEEQFFTPITSLPRAGQFEIYGLLVGKDGRGDIKGESKHLQYTYAPPQQEVPEEVAHEEVPLEEPPPSPIPYYVGMIILNLLLGAFLVVKVKNNNVSGSLKTPEVNIPEQVQTILKALQHKRTLAEVDFNDPQFSEPVRKIILSGAVDKV